jgi:hypothetical protein
MRPPASGNPYGGHRCRRDEIAAIPTAWSELIQLAVAGLFAAREIEFMNQQRRRILNPRAPGEQGINVVLFEVNIISSSLRRARAK